MKPIRVLIYDDNERIRESISMLVDSEDDFVLAGSFPNCKNLLVNISETQPEVILMDIDMPGINGIDAVTLLKKNFPEVVVLMLTVFEDDLTVFNAIQAGAGGYILKSTDPPVILEAIRQANKGGAPMTPSIAKKVLMLFQKHVPQNNNPDYKLTVREKEVLEHLVKGKSYKMIADLMDIDYETVRKHMQHIYQKLQVASMTEAVAKAINEKFF